MTDTAPPGSPEPSIVNVPTAPIVPAKPRQGVSCLVWLVDITLFVVAVVGALYTWPTQAELMRLTKKRSDLERRVGQMPIGDENKYHILRLPSEKPGEIRWRVYSPQRSSTWVRIKSDSSGGSSSSSGSSSGPTKPAEGLIRAVFTFDEADATPKLSVKFRIGESRSTYQTQIYDKKIIEQVRNSDFSTWNIAGNGEVTTCSLDKVVHLLHVKSSGDPAQQDPGGLLEVSFGTQEAATKESGT